MPSKSPRERACILDLKGDWTEVSGNTSPSKLVFFSKALLLKYDFFRLLVAQEGLYHSRLAKLLSFFRWEWTREGQHLYRQNDAASDMRILLKVRNATPKRLTSE